MMNGNTLKQCRICLAHGAEILLFGSEESKEIVSKLSQCIHEQVEDKDGYPRHICTSCNDTLNTVCNFVKTFRESNKLLEKASKTIVKEEFVDITDNNILFFYDCGIEVEHDTLKKEPKIEFDNAQQFLELLKPFQSKIKNKPNKKIKDITLLLAQSGKKVPNSKIKKKIKTNLVKKGAKVKVNTERSGSILEGKNSENSHMKEEDITVDIEFNKTTKETEKKKKEPSKVLCDLCGDVFNSEEQFGERPAVCTVCDSRFYHKYYLKEHMRLHTGETPFKCPICNRGYAQRGNMKSHVRHRHSLSQVSELTLKTLKPSILKILKPS